MTGNLLEIKDLTIQNNPTGELLLESVSFSVKRKKITGIVGESGSGKSITALSILKLLPQQLLQKNGTAFYDRGLEDVDLYSLPAAEMNKIRGKDISMIFQEPMTSLNPSMTCGRQVLESILYHQNISLKAARNKILELFEKTGLPSPGNIYTSYPHQLSGGQRQRLMIAMALINNPKLLIADEPTTALDVSIQKSIIELLRELQKEFSLSIIFISHDLRLLGEIADDIMVMKNGKVIEQNTKEEIFFNAKAAYTRGLLECQPPMDRKPVRLLTVEDFESGDLLKKTKLYTTPEPEKKTASKKEELLTIKDLSVSYSQRSGLFLFGRKTFQAINHVSLRLYKGETLGLVGESGCGKTTLGKTILMLVENSSGSILFKGKKLQEMNRKERKAFRKKVQVVFQDPYSSLNPRMKIGTVLKEARQIHFAGESSNKRSEKINNLISKSGLNNQDLQKYPHEFSGGQRQRIGIVRALITEPELLVLDESVSALDVSVQAQILNLLNDLKQDFDLSYIFISHDLAVVKYMSDRVIVMNKGVFEEKGSSREIYEKPRSEYTRKLISAVPGYQNSSGST